MNVLPDYYLLLKAAQDTANAVDNFDVTSTNPASLSAFNELCKESDEAQKAFLTYVGQNFEALKANFEVVLSTDTKDDEKVSDEEE